MTNPLVLVVDDDKDLGASVARLMVRHGYRSESFDRPERLLGDYPRSGAQCVITDVMMGDTDGFALAERMRVLDPAAAIIFMTAWPTTANAVDSIRHHGGLDYLEKPLDEDRLLTAVAEAISWSDRRRESLRRTAALSNRERQVFDLLTKGHSNKAIAERLGLSPRTVEDHRASVMAKTGTSSIAQLIDIAGD